MAHKFPAAFGRETWIVYGTLVTGVALWGWTSLSGGPPPDGGLTLVCLLGAAAVTRAVPAASTTPTALSRVRLAGVGALLGMGGFFLLYDTIILDPTYVDWLLGVRDSAGHFLGWHFFRSEPWTIPIGRIASYNYPFGTALVYTDSLPLLAIPLKLVSPLLPVVFQLEGLWLFLCYGLQGVFASLIFGRVTSQPIILWAGIVIMVLSPTVFHRGFAGHEALAGQWVILAAIHLSFFRGRFPFVKWFLLLAAVSAIHAYLLAMVGAIWAASLVREFIVPPDGGGRVALVRRVAITTAMLVVTWWQLGYFVVRGSGLSEEGLGDYSMNLVAPINPMYGSTFLSAAPTFPLQYEGFNYWGVGVIILVLIAAATLAVNRQLWNLRRHLPYALMAAGLTAFALSDTVTFRDRVLFEIPMPAFVEQVWATFRSTGRMFWPVSYLFIVASVTVIVRSMPARRATAVVSLALILQLVDVFPTFAPDQSWVARREQAYSGWVNPLKSEFWEFAAGRYEELALVYPRYDATAFVPLALFAANHGMRFNAAHAARFDTAQLDQYLTQMAHELVHGELAPTRLYALIDEGLDHAEFLANGSGAVIDGIRIIAPGGDDLVRRSGMLPAPALREDRTITGWSTVRSQIAAGHIVALSVRNLAAAPSGVANGLRASGGNVDAHDGSYRAVIQDGVLVEERRGPGELSVDVSGFHLQLGDFDDVESPGRVSINGWNYTGNRLDFLALVLNEATGEVRRYAFVETTGSTAAGTVKLTLNGQVLPPMRR